MMQCFTPTYRQPENDARAGVSVAGGLFPGYEIIGIDCRALIKQHGLFALCYHAISRRGVEVMSIIHSKTINHRIR